MKKKLLMSALLSAAVVLGSAGMTFASTSANPPLTQISKGLIKQELAGKIPAFVAQEMSNSGKLGMGEPVPGFPKGVPPVSSYYFHFSSSQIAKLKAGHFTAGIVMHTMSAAWPRLQIAGITNTLKKFGIKVIAVTDANFDPATQINDLETMIARHPSVIFSIPVDAPTEVNAYKKVAAAGIKLVFMDNVPPNMTPGKDYVNVVASNNGGNTVFAVNQLVNEVGPKAQVGVMTLGTYYWSVLVRFQAAMAKLNHYPHMNVVTGTFTNPGQQAYNIALDMMQSHPNMKGMWLAWNTPAEGAVAAEKALGRHLVITTNDLGPISSLDIANGSITAIGAQRPYDQGVAEANSAAYSLLGLKVPFYIEVPTLPVTRADLIPAYKAVMHTAVPQDVIQTLESYATGK